MLETKDILDTINMIDNENLDVRTITMGISLLDCMDSDIDRACEKIYDKICRYAQDLVKTGEDISREYGIPIIHKRISVTPVGMLAAPCQSRNIVKFAKTLDKAADTVGVNFVGGYSALVQKGYSRGACVYAESLFLGQCRLYKGRHKYGRRKDDGKDCKEVCGAYRRQRLYRPGKACCVLQRTGG